MRTIISYLHDKITTFLMSGKDANIDKLKIESDLVTHFFDSVDTLSDSAVYAFLEDLKGDLDLIV